MKKKVLIIMPSMGIGGAERSLLGLLDSFDYDRVDVSLFLYRHTGEFLKYVNPSVTILPPIPEYETFDVPVKSLLKSGKWKSGLLRLYAKARQKIQKKRHPDESGLWMYLQMISQSLQISLPQIPGQYDLAVQFLSVPDVLANKVNARVKAAWNHTDYTKLRPVRSYDRKVYGQIDYIVSVSEECREQFLKIYPEMERKAVVIENILSKDLILKQAEDQADGFTEEADVIKVLSIGRYDYAKNYDNVPDICKRILDNGIDLRWYIIGYGKREEQIKNAVEAAGMTQRVILLGKKTNPYPYIRECDVYIQPSRYEGKSVTVREAQLLGKPVIITDYATAHDQVEDGTDGLIVPLNNVDCAQAVSEYLKDPSQLAKLGKNCISRDYTNRNEIQKLYEMMQ